MDDPKFKMRGMRCEEFVGQYNCTAAVGWLFCFFFLLFFPPPLSRGPLLLFRCSGARGRAAAAGGSEREVASCRRSAVSLKD